MSLMDGWGYCMKYLVMNMSLVYSTLLLDSFGMEIPQVVVFFGLYLMSRFRVVMEYYLGPE